MASYAELVSKGTHILMEAQIEEAGLDAWLLLEYVTKKGRAWYLANQKETVPAGQEAEYFRLLELRKSRIPLQHLTHRAYFMGYEFYVNEHVLIPRQDTECLVEKALELLDQKAEKRLDQKAEKLLDKKALELLDQKAEEPRILDMCTGSGCILTSLLLERPGARGDGADISSEALQVAMENAVRLGTDKRSRFVQSDLFSSPYFSQRNGKTTPGYDMIISNPPYISHDEIDSLQEEVRLHDPREALDGGADGLMFYRRITAAAGEYLKPGGWLLFEIGCEQGPAVLALMRENGFEHTETGKDLCGLDRIVCGQKRFRLQEENHV